MYIKLEQKHKCLKCGSTNEPEYVMKSTESFIRCVDCGHEGRHTETEKISTGIQSIIYTYNKNHVIEY